jgi:hypothetical protein
MMQPQQWPMPQCTDMQGKSVTSHHKSEAAMSKDSNLPRTHKSQFGAHIHGHGHGTWNMTIGIRLTCACTCTCNVHVDMQVTCKGPVLLRPYILVKRSTRLRRLHAGLTPLPLSLSSDDRLTFRHETCARRARCSVLPPHSQAQAPGPQAQRHPGELVAKVGYFGVKSAKVCRAQMGDQTC